MQRERKYIARIVINNMKCIKHYFKVSKLRFKELPGVHEFYEN